MVGGTIAMQYKDEFVIHAHDWLTYLAGAPRNLQANRLWFMCTLLFDEAPMIWWIPIEKRGMVFADRVVTVRPHPRNSYKQVWD